jgi:hypothetical protein
MRIAILAMANLSVRFMLDPCVVLVHRKYMDDVALKLRFVRAVSI